MPDTEESIEQPPVKRLIDREIFAWDCHGERRKADPMVLQRRMSEEALRLNIDPSSAAADIKLATADLSSSSPEERKHDEAAAMKAHSDLAAITKAGFLLKGIEDDQDNGWTEKELIALLGRFWTWCEELKKNTSGSPN